VWGVAAVGFMSQQLLLSAIGKNIENNDQLACYRACMVILFLLRLCGGPAVVIVLHAFYELLFQMTLNE
jgi:hypothetical protein